MRVTTTPSRTSSQRLRILILAEQCNPEWVSVPLVGWSLYRALSSLADVHLVTQVRNRRGIEKAGLRVGIDATIIDSERVARPLWRILSVLRGGAGKGWTAVTAINSLSYYYFEYLVWKTLGTRISAGDFDLVHRITPLSPTTPSVIASRCRRAHVPFIVGPLNGGVPWPRAFDSARRKEGEWLSYVRSAHKLLPGHQSTRRNASAIIIGSRDTWKQIPLRSQQKCVYIPENGVDPCRFAAGRTHRAVRPITAVFLGRLVPYKGADMLIEAAAPFIRSGDLRLKLIGDGPEMPFLRDRIQREGVTNGVVLVGWVPHRDVHEHLSKADVLAFPSIREFGGGVVLEAMAVGLVPIVVDYAGPAELVTRETGWLIPIGTREEIIRRLQSVFEELVRNPGEIDRKSPLAQKRVFDLFTWKAKAIQTTDVYKWVLGIREKPTFGMPFGQ